MSQIEEIALYFIYSQAFDFSTATLSLLLQVFNYL